MIKNTIEEKIFEATGISDWKRLNGLDSGTGVDHWFHSPSTGKEVYVNNDQGCVTIVNGPYEPDWLY